MCILYRTTCTTCSTILHTTLSRRCSMPNLLASSSCPTTHFDTYHIPSCAYCTPRPLENFAPSEVREIAFGLLAAVSNNSSNASSKSPDGSYKSPTGSGTSLNGSNGSSNASAVEQDSMLTEFGMTPVCGPEGGKRQKLLEEMQREIWSGEWRVGGIPFSELERAQMEMEMEEESGYEGDDEEFFDAEEGEGKMDVEMDVEMETKVQYESGSEEGEIREVKTVKKVQQQQTVKEMTPELGLEMAMDLDESVGEQDVLEQRLDKMIREEEFEQSLDKMTQEEEFEQSLDEMIQEEEFEQSLNEMIEEEEMNQIRFEIEALDERRRELERECKETVDDINRKLAEMDVNAMRKRVESPSYGGQLEVDENGGFRIRGAAAEMQLRRELQDLPRQLQRLRV